MGVFWFEHRVEARPRRAALDLGAVSERNHFDWQGSFRNLNLSARIQADSEEPNHVLEKITGLRAGITRSGADSDRPLGEVAKRFQVSVSEVSRVRTRRERLGQTRSGAQRCHVPLRLGALEQAVLAWIKSDPDQTLVQLSQRAQATHGITVKPSTMNKTLVRLGVTRKKDSRERAVARRFSASAR